MVKSSLMNISIKKHVQKNSRHTHRNYRVSPLVEGGFGLGVELAELNVSSLIFNLLGSFFSLCLCSCLCLCLCLCFFLSFFFFFNWNPERTLNASAARYKTETPHLGGIGFVFASVGFLFEHARLETHRSLLTHYPRQRHRVIREVLLFWGGFHQVHGSVCCYRFLLYDEQILNLPLGEHIRVCVCVYLFVENNEFTLQNITSQPKVIEQIIWRKKSENQPKIVTYCYINDIVRVDT